MKQCVDEGEGILVVEVDMKMGVVAVILAEVAVT